MNKELLHTTKKILLFFAALIFLIITGCHFNSSYNNREEDKKDGEIVISEFYELLKNGDFKATYKLFDKRFFEITDTQKLNEIYNLSLEKLGEVESYEIEKWETEAIIGTDSRTNYVFLCDVKRSNFTSKESITLIKEKDEITILSYYVNSAGFLNK